jgi:hypothetical protein
MRMDVLSVTWARSSMERIPPPNDRELHQLLGGMVSGEEKTAGSAHDMTRQRHRSVGLVPPFRVGVRMD